MLVREKNCSTVFLFPKKREKVRLVIRGKNLVMPEYNTGYLKAGRNIILQKESKEFLTTRWFAVEKTGAYLVMSGDAYNRAVWQFATADGTIYNTIPTEKKYRLNGSKLFGRTFPRVKIPKDAVRCRVFFRREADIETLEFGERLQIEYGLIPTSFEAYQEKKKVPECREDGSAVCYREGFWYQVVLNDDEREAVLADETTAPQIADTVIAGGRAICLNTEPELLDIGQSVYLECMKEGATVEPVQTTEVVCYAEKNQQDDIQTGIYGVRRRLDDSVPVLERIYDATGLRFNLKHGEEWATPYKNSFDSIYPWCAIRRCAVSFPNGIRRVIYEGEEGYTTDGSAGDVMVEIPKHYVRRVVENGYEELAISAKPAEGFVLDPSFVTVEGEQEAIYVAAYFAAEEQNCLRSKKGMQVSLNESADFFTEKAANNHGFELCDMCAILTLQRLFLVESAVLDAQAVMQGNVYMPFMIWDKMSTYYSLKDAENTNTICLKKNSISDRYWVGDAVAVMDRWKHMEEPEFANQMRVIEHRTVREDDTVDITFSGNPVNLKAHDTGMSTLPPHTGAADELGYSVGMKGNHLQQDGHMAFTYRGIESLWGGVWIVLSHCSVTDSRLRLEYPDGRSVVVSYRLPEQATQLTSKQFGNPEGMCVRAVGYDAANPLIALPEKIGDGASTCSYYCDAWFNKAEQQVEYVVTYGGAWDNMGYAGVSAFRATFTPEQKVMFNGARLMTRAKRTGKSSG